MVKKKVKFYTFGCKVNQYETQAMREQFLQGGFCESENEVADCYVVNTCTVTANSDKESLKIIRRLSQKWPKAKIIAIGCLAEKNKSSISSISPKVYILSNHHKDHILDFVSKTESSSNRINTKVFSPLKISRFKNHERAFIKIQDGCNNYCSYCKVPIVRGASRSRKFNAVIEEVERLIEGGFKEIVLSGICLGDYHYRFHELADLLNAFGQIRGEFRIRLSSIEPQMVSDRLIEAMQSQLVCAHLHLPLQSADNRVLKHMNRSYSCTQYEALVKKVRKRIKNVSITTDVLVGFPGESDAQFKKTLECLKRIVPLRTHVFPFSPREYTKAQTMHPRVERVVIKQRTALVRKLAQKTSFQFRKKFLDKKLFVLVESRLQGKGHMRGGYSGNYIPVSISNATSRDVAKIVSVKVEKVDEQCTQGRIIR